MIHKEITDKQWQSIKKYLPRPAKLGCQDVMIKQQLMEFCLF